MSCFGTHARTALYEPRFSQLAFKKPSLLPQGQSRSYTVGASLRGVFSEITTSMAFLTRASLDYLAWKYASTTAKQLQQTSKAGIALLVYQPTNIKFHWT